MQHLRKKKIDQVGVSTITLSELEYGVAKSQYPERNSVALIDFLTPFQILEYAQSSAHEYGRIRSLLESREQPIGPLDMLIAAHTLALGLILVTINECEFRRIPSLAVENWITR